MFRRTLTILVAIATALWLAVPGIAQETQTCVADETSEETETLDESDVTVTWIGSHWCLEAPEEGTYQATLDVTFEGADDFELEGVTIRHTTPRPGGSGPNATVEIISVTPTDDGAKVTIEGDYELVQTDEGPKANIHLTATGTATGTNGEDDPFRAGFNVHLRGADAVEDGGDEGDGQPEGAGPPEELPVELPADAGSGDSEAVDEETETAENGEENAEENTEEATERTVDIVFDTTEDPGDAGATVDIETVDGQLVITVFVTLPGGVMIT